MVFASAIAAAAFILVHLFGARLRFLAVIPRSRWLSAAGGASVAYVFVQLFPEIAEAQETLAEHARGPLARLDRHAYLLSLLGLATFYGLERLTLETRATRSEGEIEDRQKAKSSDERATGAAFALSIGSFAIYNALLGYVVARSDRTALGLVAYALAIAFHFLVNDYALRDHHKQLYDRIGRWVLMAAVIGGMGLGWTVDVHEAAVVAVMSFLAGGIVLNVLKEELPAERRSRFWAFAVGAGGYASVLLAVGD